MLSSRDNGAFSHLPIRAVNLRVRHRQRRPHEELSTLAVLDLSRLFVDTTGVSHHEHVKSLFNVVFAPQLGKVTNAVIRQRLSRQPRGFWFDIPPTHKLGGERRDRRLWVLLMKVQASANVHEIERQWLAIHHKANIPRKKTVKTRATAGHRYKPLTRMELKRIAGRIKSRTSPRSR